MPQAIGLLGKTARGASVAPSCRMTARQRVGLLTDASTVFRFALVRCFQPAQPLLQEMNRIIAAACRLFLFLLELQSRSQSPFFLCQSLSALLLQNAVGFLLLRLANSSWWAGGAGVSDDRSEERRVGKECR